MSYKQAPAWVQNKIAAMQPQNKKLFLFPIGDTVVEINMEQPPQERDLGNGKRTIYTAKINGNVETFTPSKTLEKLILDMLMQGHSNLVISRSGLGITDTKYSVQWKSEKAK